MWGKMGRGEDGWMLAFTLSVEGMGVEILENG